MLAFILMHIIYQILSVNKIGILLLRYFFNDSKFSILFIFSSLQKPTEPPVSTAVPPFKPPPRLPLGVGLKPFENPATSLSLFSGNGFTRNQKIPVPTHTGILECMLLDVAFSGP